MSEGSLFFENKGAVQESLRRIADRLEDESEFWDDDDMEDQSDNEAL